MNLLRIFQILLMAVTWTNVEVEVPVYSSIDEYITIPTAKLTENGDVFLDPDMYYVYDGVDNFFYSDLNTNYTGIIRHKIKVVFPTYNIESKQEIIFNVVDKIKPTITNIPTFQILVGQNIPDLTVGLDYYDNYDPKEELIVNVLGIETINNKKVGKYFYNYQVVDKSSNVETVSSYVLVVDLEPPEITKIKDVVIELGDTFDVFNFYKFTDNHDNFVEVTVDDGNVDFTKPGRYNFIIMCQDASGNIRTKQDILEIIYTQAPTLVLYENIIEIEVNSSNLSQILTENIKEVSDKLDNLTIADVSIIHTIRIDKLGTYDVTYEVTNSKVKTTNKIIKLNVNDSTRPTIEVIKDLMIPYGITSFIPKDYFNIYDNYDHYSDLVIHYTHKIDLNKLGTYPIKVEVIDKSKNKSVLEETVTVADLEAPIFETILAELEVEVFSKVSFDFLKVRDNVDLNPSISPNEMYFDKVGNIVLVITATDKSGNQNQMIINVNVIDNESPVIILSSNEVKIGLNENKIDARSYLVDAYDNYDNFSVDDVMVIDNVNYQKLGKYEIVYYLIDQAGNEKTSILIVSIDDTTAPIITTTNTIINQGVPFDLWEEVEVVDNDVELILKTYPKSIDTNQVGTYTITYLAIDQRGNIGKTQRQITIVDSKEKIRTPLLITINLVVTSAITATIYLVLRKRKRF